MTNESYQGGRSKMSDDEINAMTAHPPSKPNICPVVLRTAVQLPNWFSPTQHTPPPAQNFAEHLERESESY